MATTKRKARTDMIDTIMFAIYHELKDRNGFYFLKRKGCPVKTFSVKDCKPRLTHDEINGYHWVIDLITPDDESITIDKDTVSLAFFGWMNGEDNDGCYQEISTTTLYGRKVTIKEVQDWIDKSSE